IPNKVANIHNNAETFKPYNPGEVIGDINPTLPDPPPPAQPGKGCGTVGTIIMVVVAIVATIYTAGAAAGLLAEAAASSFAETMVLGATVLEGTSGLGMVAVAAAAIGGAVGSIASQAVGDAMGNTRGFSWKAVATSAIGSAVSAGVGWGMNAAFGTATTAATTTATTTSTTMSTAEAFEKGAEQFGIGVANAVGSSAVQQALKGEWSWRQIGAAAVGAAAGQAAGGIMGDVLGSSDYAKIATRTVAGMANGWASGQVLATDPRYSQPKLGTLFANSLGNALGEAISDKMQQVAAADKAKRDSLYGLGGQGLNLTGRPNAADQWSAMVDQRIAAAAISPSPAPGPSASDQPAVGPVLDHDAGLPANARLWMGLPPEKPDFDANGVRTEPVQGGAYKHTYINVSGKAVVTFDQNATFIPPGAATLTSLTKTPNGLVENYSDGTSQPGTANRPVTNGDDAFSAGIRRNLADMMGPPPSPPWWATPLAPLTAAKDSVDDFIHDHVKNEALAGLLRGTNYLFFPETPLDSLTTVAPEFKLEGLLGKSAVKLEVSTSERLADNLFGRTVSTDARASIHADSVLGTMDTRIASDLDGGRSIGAIEQNEAVDAERAAADAVQAQPRQLFKFSNVEDFNRKANDALPNSNYEFGNYVWKTDDRGRIASVEGQVSINPQDGRAGTDGWSTVKIGQGPDSQPGDVGFHLIGDQFGGPTNKLNVVPGNGFRLGADVPNLNQGAYKSWEEYVKGVAANNPNAVVEMRVEPVYNLGNLTSRPDAFNASHRIDGGNWTTRIFRNTQGG
ncbi:MAG: DNA/RNA non-specific endonuclease, partial [Burkholderiales bacterium]|nr:DNA/RNA non-specific endonuclease [Burkholderiales bacterium]